MAGRSRRYLVRAARAAWCLAWLAAAALWSVPASACIYNSVIYFVGDPPAGLTDPAEIEAWKEEQVRQAKANALVRFEQHWRAYKRQLSAEARQGKRLGADKLADDLATAMVPPLLPQWASRSDCGDLYGPELRDPAGYLDTEEAMAAHLVELGILSDPAALPRLPARAIRDFEFKSLPCTQEARNRVRARLLRRFSRGELARVWSEIHRLGFDNNPSENGVERDYSSGPRTFRLLKFAEGRSGPLVFSDGAPAAFDARESRAIWNAQALDRAELRRFFETDPVAVRMVDEIEAELAGESVERCPETAAQYAALAVELRAQIEERARRYQR